MVYGDLVDSGEVVFDGVLDGDDVAGGVVDLIQRRVEGGGFARSGGAGDEDDAVGSGHEGFVEFLLLGEEAESVQGDGDSAFVQDAHTDFFAVDGGHGGDAEVEGHCFYDVGDAAILWAASFGDIELGHDLDAADDGGVVAVGDDHLFVEDAVHSVADPDLFFLGFDVD